MFVFSYIAKYVLERPGRIVGLARVENKSVVSGRSKPARISRISIRTSLKLYEIIVVNGVWSWVSDHCH